MSAARRAVLIAAILIVALALRVAAVQEHAYAPRNDAGAYLTLASDISHTGDYTLSRNPGVGAGGTRGPSAYFAPGFPYFLAAVDIIDGHEVRRDGAIHRARIAMALLGTITVALIGLVAFELFGAVAGVFALALAAVYPVLIELSSILVAENLLTALALGAVYCGLRVRRSRTIASACGWIAGAGVLTGLATLTHENGILILLPLLVVVSRRTPPAKRQRLIGPALLIATTAFTIAPWTIRNAVVMHSFIPVSDETGITLVGTYNPASAANPQVPYKWRIFFGIPGERSVIRQRSHLTERQLSAKLERHALNYIAGHPLSPIEVAFYNTLRLFELEGSFAWHASAAAQSIAPHRADIGITSFWILCALAIAGSFTKLTRAAPRWVWFVPLLLALSVVLVNVETPRFRAPVDPFLILLAAAGLATAATRVRTGLGGTPVVGETRDPVPARAAQLIEMRERLA
ncbi:MAG: glycosyltransferase family 39 protein [Solirubrobacterales bacterium]|nr:glycosyltransferase family 39 protein [Solirubrobacterales bacterium]